MQQGLSICWAPGCHVSCACHAPAKVCRSISQGATKSPTAMLAGQRRRWDSEGSWTEPQARRTSTTMHGASIRWVALPHRRTPLPRRPLGAALSFGATCLLAAFDFRLRDGSIEEAAGQLRPSPQRGVSFKNQLSSMKGMVCQDVLENNEKRRATHSPTKVLCLVSDRVRPALASGWSKAPIKGVDHEEFSNIQSACLKSVEPATKSLFSQVRHPLGMGTPC